MAPTRSKPAEKPTEKPALNDPLEGAKLFAPVPEAPSAPPPPVVEFKPSGEIEPPAKAKPRYRVAATTTISISGQMVRLNREDVISESLYGAEAYAKIVASSGVALTLLEE